MTIRPRRSMLYMPGSNARALEKAKTLATDAVILDLEDSVAPDAKATARDQVMAVAAAGGFGSREVVIRVNGLSGPWGMADLEAAAITVAPAIAETLAEMRSRPGCLLARMSGSGATCFGVFEEIKRD